MTCLTKIKNIKIIIFLLFVFFSITQVQADSWIKIKNNKNLPLYIETTFIEYNYNNQSAIYTIKYQNKNLMNYILIKSDCKNFLAGVADSKLGLPLNSKYNFVYSTVSAPMKSIKHGTPIYYAHNYVCKQLRQETLQQENQINTKEADFDSYMKELQRKIKLNWEPPNGTESKRVVVIFKIGKDGRLISHMIFNSSGSPAADKAALQAVELAAPFYPLPPEYKGDSVDIQFTFDYNVFKEN